MSSKKIWAASLAAVIAGSSFAVVASAKNTVDPGASGKVSVSGTDVECFTESKYVEEVKANGTTIEIKPTTGAYGAGDDAKIKLTVKLSNKNFDSSYTIVEGDLKGKIENGAITVTDVDFDLTKVGESKEYEVSVKGQDKDTITVKFTIKNTGTFTDASFDYEKGDFVKLIDKSGKKEKDTVIVVYDAAEVGAKAGNMGKISFTANGTASLNGTKVTCEEEVKYSNCGVSTGGYGDYKFTLKDPRTDKPGTDANEVATYEKKVDFHFMTQEEYDELEDLPADESKPADESSNTSTEESKPTVSTSEVKVEVGEDGVLEGADLTKAVFVDTLANKTWNDVKTVTFKSEVPFSLGFAVKAGAVKDKADATWYQKGVDELAKEDLPESAFATEWTLTEEEVAAMIEGSETDTLKLTTKDGKAATITAKVTVKETAPNTGIALAIAPAALATAFVTVAAVMSKKKKG